MLFPFDGNADVISLLKIYKPFKPVTLCKAVVSAAFVFKHTPFKITSNADINGSRFIGDDVHGGVDQRDPSLRSG